MGQLSRAHEIGMVWHEEMSSRSEVEVFGGVLGDYCFRELHTEWSV